MILVSPSGIYTFYFGYINSMCCSNCFKVFNTIYILYSYVFRSLAISSTMVDRSKELYQQQLAAHAAWANFGGASGYNPSAGHGGFGAGSSSMSAGAPGASSNPYENYMQRLQQLSGQHNPGMFGSNFLGNGAKDMASFPSPFGLPPGHPMHFPGIGNYNPLPAHSPLPAHMKNSTTPPSTPLPAHMRSSPYQQSSYYSSPYNMPGYGAPPSQSPAPGQYGDEVRRQAAAMHNGGSGFVTPEMTSAYSQLQQLQAAYSQAATAKELNKKSSSSSVTAVTTNNNYSSYSPHTTTSSYSHPTSGSVSNNSNYDQIAAALLNRFSGQFNSQFMSEMVKTAQVNSAAAAAAGYQPLSVPNFTSLSQHRDARDSREASKPSSKPPAEPVSKPSPEMNSQSDLTEKPLKRPPDLAENPNKRPPDRTVTEGQNGPLQSNVSVSPRLHQEGREPIATNKSASDELKAQVNNNENPLENHSIDKLSQKTDPVENNHVNNLETSRQTPVSSTAASMSITNKIKDLQSRQSSNSSKQVASSLSNDDRSELKGLWKMQAQLFQQKPIQKPKPTTVAPTSSTSVSPSVPVTTIASSDSSSTVTSSIPNSSISSTTITTSTTSSTSSKHFSSSISSMSSPSPVPHSVTAGPPLIHTPRSPPHPPPPLPPTYSHHFDGKSHPYNPHHPVYSAPSSQPSQPYYVPPPSSSSYPPPSYVPPRPTLPPVPASTASSLETNKNSKNIDSNQAINQNERMEVKNSGIPGPSAISWKRKSVEDSPSCGNSTKKRKPNENVNDRDDPYSFEEDDKSKGSEGLPDFSSEQTNGNITGGGYKYKSALLSRENDVESDESSMSGSSSPNKKKKRPKLEEWSVNKEKKNKSKSPNSKMDKADDSEKTDKSQKKGALWGLPNLPNITKPPVKNEKVKKEIKQEEKVIEKASNKSSVTNVWLQAFGAGGGGGKAKKKENDDPPSNLSNGAKKPIKTEKEPVVVASKTILDIPPEVRRKPRPKFGGLIHFDPDWNRAVRRHHERCRVPTKIENSSLLKPKILAGQQTPKKSYEDHARKAMVSPPNMLAIEKERLEKNAQMSHKLPVSSVTDDELSGELPSIVETILENRKKLREGTDFSRIYKVPFMKEKKKRMMRAPVQNEVKTGNLGLLPTPGLPLLTDDTKDVLLGSGFGNFRQYTLSKFMQNECKWTDLVPETKPRRQTSASKPAINIREIFGMETPKKSKKSAEDKTKKQSEEKCKKSIEERLSEPTITPSSSSHSTPVKKEKKRKSEKKTESQKPSPPVKNNTKFEPKFRSVTPVDREPEEECGYSHEVGDPSDKEKNLQYDLGAFALDLLEDNPSWTKQVAIQNLVIWEPAEPEIQDQGKKKKGKKKRSKKSGLDFQSNKRKSKTVAASRAGSPVEEDIHEVVYNLDNVINESNRWVIDKNAGETILHRASKMGYPDVAAYALDMAAMGPGDRDYAGLTPLHKAALKGNSNVAKILLSYGADPSAGVKGTRALHEGNVIIRG